MKIIRLESENFKRLIAVEIEPKTHIVKISGRNKQGKTSCLDSIWALLAGDKAVPKKPIRDGATRSRLYADLGDLEVTKIITKSGSRLEVKYKDKSIPEKSPQKAIDGLLGKYTLDPREFSAMDSKRQYNHILSMVDVPNVDEHLLKIAEKTGDNEIISDAKKIINTQTYDPILKFKKVYEIIYAIRTAVNREAQKLKGAIEKIQIPAELSELGDNMSSLLSEREELFRKDSKRREKIQLLENKREKKLAVQDNINRLKSDIENLKSMLSKKEAELETLEGDLFECGIDVKTSEDELSQIKEIDFSDINEKIKLAEENASIFEEKRKKEELKKDHHEQEHQSNVLTTALQSIEKRKIEILQKVEFPVQKLSLGEGYLLYNNQPFDQASDAERLLVSCLISIKENPELRIIRIRDGSLMDNSSWDIIEKIAEKYDFQIWVEVVADEPGCGFYIEDGQLVE